MLHPLTRSSSGRLRRSTRHSKKSTHLLKSHVANNHRGTFRIRRSGSRKSINVYNSIISGSSRPKIALPDSSSEGKRLSNDVPKTSKYRFRSKSESILETPARQLKKKSMLKKHFQDESTLKVRKGITEIESISTGYKRMTRSSMENIHGRNLIKNRSHESRLAIPLVPKSTKKHIKLKTTAKVKELNVPTEESKRMTRSSIGKVTCNKFLKSRRSKDKLITLHASTEKHVKSKVAVKEKDLNIITENPKRLTLCSIGSTIVSFSQKKISKDHYVTSSMLKNIENLVDPKHMAPSSFQTVTDNIHDRNLIKNRSHENRLGIPLVPKSTKKHIKLKTTAKVKELNVPTEESKRMTRSSIGKCNKFLKSRRSKDKLITLHASIEKHVKSKVAVKEKDLNIITKNPKRVTLCSIGGTIVSSSQKKISKDRYVASSMHKNIENLVDPKHISPSSFQTVSNSTPLIKKTPNSKNLISTSLSAQVGVGSKKSEKEAVIIQKDSEQIKRCSLNNALNSLKPTKNESEKQRKARNSTPVSVNDTKAVQRKNNSGSLSAWELPKRSRKSSTVSKGVKRKSTESPQKDKHKKNATLKTPVTNEDGIPLDCLTMNTPNKRPRRHTVDVCIQKKKALNVSTTLQKTKKTSTTKTKRKPSKQRKGNGTTSESNSTSYSAPDMSQFPIDCLTTFQSKTKTDKKRPKSAPAAIKRKLKVAGFQTPIPGKGTLKRQRWMFNALKEKNEGYEDDIFENQKFQTPPFRILNEVDDESDSSIPTPKFGFLLTPAIPKKTPKYKETISSSDLFLARKNAEEYLFRRNKKRASDNSTLNSLSKSQTSIVCDEVPEKKKLEFAEVIEKVEAIRKSLEEKNEDDESEDDYFTDALF